MKKLLICTVAAALSVAAFAQVPAVTVENFSGESVKTASVLKRGRPVILSFWSTTCKPCIHELDAYYESLPDWKEEADFDVVAVSTDDNRLVAKARSMAQGHGWKDDFILLFDKNQDMMRAMNVTVTPQVFVLDAKGKIVYSHTGYLAGGEEDVFKAVKKALGK